jgi:hypothetical protein
MKRSLVILALSVAACGDLSNDDLLFLAAVPSRDEVALEVVGDAGTAGALTADQSDVPTVYRPEAVAEAEWINATAGRLLDFVATLGYGSAPSERSENRRVWGPMRNVGGEGLTVRLQIERQWLDVAPRYTFCLHMGPDGAPSGDTSCADGRAAGLYRVMSGTYQPIAGGDTRSGTGTILIDFDASEAVGASATGQSGLFTLEYDFTAGGEAKRLHVLWSASSGLGTAPDPLDYSYERDATGVHFTFQWYDDVIDGTRVERQTVDVCWTPTGAGRARVQIRGGDVPRSNAASANECWDASQVSTWYRLWVAVDSPQNVEEGNAGSCPDC